jgi:hypothetical protein
MPKKRCNTANALLGQKEQEVVHCSACNGSRACDACDGYGWFPDTAASTSDGPECDVCSGSGICAECSAPGISKELSR